jgi:hypothetical protein
MVTEPTWARMAGQAEELDHVAAFGSVGAGYQTVGSRMVGSCWASGVLAVSVRVRDGGRSACKRGDDGRHGQREWRASVV